MKLIFSVIFIITGYFIFAQESNESDVPNPENSDNVIQEENAVEQNEALPADLEIDTLKTSTKIQTAADFLALTAENYATINDLKATIKITDSISSSESKGSIFIKPPNNMRINFSAPRGQVINNNGEEFYVYIPQQNVALHQKKVGILQTTDSNPAESFVTKTGLDLLIKNYLVSYVDKPEFVPLANDPSIKVMPLKLKWKNPSQNFREIYLYVSEDMLIYKVEATTYNRQDVEFEFSDFEINEGIPDARFDYDPPPTAHVIENFLFDEEKKKQELKEEAENEQ